MSFSNLTTPLELNKIYCQSSTTGRLLHDLIKSIKQLQFLEVSVEKLSKKAIVNKYSLKINLNTYLARDVKVIPEAYFLVINKKFS